MSRNRAEETENNFSPLQKRACIVLACCAAVLILSIVGAIVLISGASAGSGEYDPTLYPVDTSLGCVLQQSSDDDATYITNTVFVGDQNTVNLSDLGLITLNQFVGADGLKAGDVINKQCVYFADDASAYTIPQAIAKMKARRVVVTLGTNDADGKMDVTSFIQNYRQALKAISTAYSYCDVIVNAIPPVAKGDSSTANRQQTIDQFNQAIAAMCDEEGYRFLNSSESLKDGSTGYAENSYFDGMEWNKNGANTFLQYVRTHLYTSDDRRPDTNDIPQRASQAAGGMVTQATPTPTATGFMANYTVEAGKGTLTGNDQTGVTSISVDAKEKQSVTVTAVAADGYTFYKWSDGQTSATRVDYITQDISVTAMFNDSRVTITLDKADTTLTAGDSLTITASVQLGDKAYDNSTVQWAVNDNLEATAGSYTFSATAAGTYVIKAGIEINGTYASAQFNITVNAPPTSISINYYGQMSAGQSQTLSASVTNGIGDTTWSCDEIPDWKPTGNSVSFTAPAGTGTAIVYKLHAVNNGVTADFSITVAPAAPAPTATATP